MITLLLEVVDRAAGTTDFARCGAGVAAATISLQRGIAQIIDSLPVEQGRMLNRAANLSDQLCEHRRNASY